MSIIQTPALLAGVTSSPTGTTSVPRSGSFRETVVSQAHGKYHEAAIRGSLFAVANATTGAAILTGFAAVPPILLSNPLNSGRRFSIKKVSIAYVSGTMGAGCFWHGLYQNLTSAPVVGAGAVITPVCLDGGNLATSAARAFTIPTSPATALGLWPIGSIFAELATTANGLQPLIEDVDGAIVLEPGNSYSVLYVGTAGTSPVVVCGIVYEDFPIIN